MVKGWAGRLVVVCIVLLLGGGCTRSRPGTTGAVPAVPTPITGISPGNRGTAITGQTIYVPAYSHIYYQDRERVINLTITLSIRNADPAQAIWIDSVQYHDANGQLLRNEVSAAIQLPPLATVEFVVEEEDTSGGSGASFLVKWSSDLQPVAPVVEAVMISAASTQGISFVSVGRVIETVSATPVAEGSGQ
ncbi:MAG: DUF3124 domain-containing protein [Caldilineaceae bacterium]|nr:DUF3124 domain-containing protein [Caldilineaceae bacterium]